jgi:hypothetical protein
LRTVHLRRPLELCFQLQEVPPNSGIEEVEKLSNDTPELSNETPKLHAPPQRPKGHAALRRYPLPFFAAFLGGFTGTVVNTAPFDSCRLMHDNEAMQA